MRTILKAGVTALALTFVVSAAHAQEKLSIYHWFEYIPQELLDKFSAETGIEVTMDTFDSNEAMLASLKAGKLGSYDVAVPGDYMVEIMIGEGMLDTVADGELANFGNIEQQWLDVPFDMGRKHSIPYQWGSTSFSVNRDVYQGDINDTSIVYDPPDELKGKINVLDAQGEVMLLASLHLGIPQCSTDREQLKALDALLQAAKPHWASFNSDGAKDVLVSGDAAVGMIWNGFGAKARAEGANIEYAYPRQGLRRLDGQCGAAQGCAQPGQRDQVHGLPAGAGEHRRGHQLRALCGRRRRRDPASRSGACEPARVRAACRCTRRHVRRGVRSGDAGGLRHHVDPPEEVVIRLPLPGGALHRGAPRRFNSL